MTRTLGRTIGRTNAAATLLVLALSIGAAPAPKSTSTPTKSAAATPAPPPFAKVYLALRGCTSCEHCRTTIRQMTKGSAQGGETRVNGSEVEVLYAKPRVVPLREVIKSLAENRLHDLNLVDVLFEASGSIAKGGDGTLRFTMAETGQSFPVTVASQMERPADGRSVRLVALVDGWRGKGNLTLVAREVRAAA
jgi:hypothetical protein